MSEKSTWHLAHGVWRLDQYLDWTLGGVGSGLLAHGITTEASGRGVGRVSGSAWLGLAWLRNLPARLRA